MPQNRMAMIPVEQQRTKVCSETPQCHIVIIPVELQKIQVETGLAGHQTGWPQHQREREREISDTSILMYRWTW